LAKHWPALDVHGPLAPLTDDDVDLLLAAVDDCSPTALEEHESGVRIFFATPEARDAAADIIATLKGSRYTENGIVRTQTGIVRTQTAIVRSATLLGSRCDTVTCAPIDVSDEDWAERSQQNLQPVTVGRITIVADAQSSIANQSAICNPQSAITLLIPPSTAFGTGHHATTRLCLAALQMTDLADAFVIDVGTGSGVLALAAAALGARRVVGIDNDPDAVAAARENLARNPQVGRVEFIHGDAREVKWSDGDVLTANLTGALIASQWVTLLNWVRPGGQVIISGVLSEEADAVAQAIGGGVQSMWVAAEDGWIGARLVKK
jgi:ribosomal protein L11 methyltransferase